MVEYARIDTSVLLTVAVLITFAVLTASLIVRVLGSVSLLRIHINGPARATGSDGGRPQSGLPLHLPIPVTSILPVRGHGFDTPMIPGAREPGKLTTFGVVDAIIPDWPKTMDAATTASRQREGGGAPA